MVRVYTCTGDRTDVQQALNHFLGNTAPARIRTVDVKPLPIAAKNEDDFWYGTQFLGVVVYEV